MISFGWRLIACCKLAPTLARQMWRHNYVIYRNEYLIFTVSESINPWVNSLQFLLKSTNNSWSNERKCEWVFFHFFSTPPLFGRKFQGVPLGVDLWRLGCKERTSQANWSWNYFWRIPTYVIAIHQRHRRTDEQTDRQTDRRTTCDRNTALCTKVHRAVKTADFTHTSLVWRPLAVERHEIST